MVATLLHLAPSGWEAQFAKKASCRLDRTAWESRLLNTVVSGYPHQTRIGIRHKAQCYSLSHQFKPCALLITRWGTLHAFCVGKTMDANIYWKSDLRPLSIATPRCEYAFPAGAAPTVPVHTQVRLNSTAFTPRQNSERVSQTTVPESKYEWTGQTQVNVSSFLDLWYLIQIVSQQIHFFLWMDLLQMKIQ